MRYVMKLVGAVVITARHRRGWNQTQLAKKAKLSLQTICKAERGGEIHPATGKVICQVLELAPEEVVIPPGAEAGDGDAA